MSNKELLEKIQQGLNTLENELLDNYTGDEERDDEVTLDSYSVAIERFQGLIDGLKEKLSQQKSVDDNIDGIKREWYNKGYIKGRQDAYIPARELGLPKKMEFHKPTEWSDEDEKMFGSIHSTLSMYMSNSSLPKEIRDIHEEELKWFDELYDKGLS